jgi:hypothetical protein
VSPASPLEKTLQICYNKHMSETSNSVVSFSHTPVESFLSASYHKDPLIYPGERPASSFITDGIGVSSLEMQRTESGLQLTVFEDGQWQSIDDYLAANDTPPMDERIPVLAFGSNMNPASLKSKFTKAGRADMLVIPTVYAMLEGSDIVWSGGPGINGNFTAVLYSGPETEESEVQVGINFLTREQLLLMHASELNYQLAETPVMVAGEYIPVCYYAGRDSVYLKDGKPVAVAGIPASNRALIEYSGVEMLELFLDDYKVMTSIVGNARGYIDFVRSLRKTDEQPEPKLQLKRAVQRVLAERGLTAKTSEDTDDYLGWANPSTLRSFKDIRLGREPTQIYVLPTSDIPKGAWPNPAARDKVLEGVITHDERTSDRNKVMSRK